MITRNIKEAERLINTLINETITRWASAPDGEVYLIRHTEESDGTRIVIQPTHSDTFYGMSDYIHIAEVCGCSMYVTCEENLDGKITPTLHIY
jgi:hypothetical protein